jgi:hypothetical protein
MEQSVAYKPVCGTAMSGCGDWAEELTGRQYGDTLRYVTSITAMAKPSGILCTKLTD